MLMTEVRLEVLVEELRIFSQYERLQDVSDAADTVRLECAPD